MQRSLGVLVVSFALFAPLSVACGGGTDKPPLTPDDQTANALDAGDVPPVDPNAPAPAAPPAK
jgi:hypothetical protein